MEPAWLDRKEYPFQHNFFDINAHRMHYVDEGQGKTILFVHGTPSWSFDFRKVVIDLRNDHRCIAIDHIGFGLSDKPKDYDYSTMNHSATLERFILERELDELTLVVHDFGGPIGLNVAIKHSNRIKRLVILNSWLWSSETDPDFTRVRKILRSPLLPFLYRQLNFSPRFILPNAYGDKKPSKEILMHYTKPFRNADERNGTLAFAKSLLHDQGWFEKLWESRSEIQDIPTLFIWGMKDPIIKEKALKKFESGFIASKTVRIETAGHFPQEEAPTLVATSIREFIQPDHTQHHFVKHKT